MNLLSKLFAGGIGTLVESVGNVVDKLSTSTEEKLAMKLELEKEINRFKTEQMSAISNYDKEITDRHRSDMQSDSYLSKNIRPLTLAFLTLTTVALAWASIFFLSKDKVDLLKPWISLLTTLDVTAMTFYFGSRGLEKVFKIKNK